MKFFNFITINITIWIILVGFSCGIYFTYYHEYSITTFIFIFICTLSSIFLLIIFVQKRNLLSKLYWIFIILFLPLIGSLLFILFGRRYSQRKSLVEYRKKTNFKFENLETNLVITNENIKKLLNKQSKLSSRGIYPGNFTFYYKGNEIFEALFTDLKKAKKFIHLHYYIIKYGEIFEEFQTILIKKASQGVEIKIIIDDFGRWNLPMYKIKELKKHGIQVVLFKKVWQPFVGSESNFRTHRKMVVIDGRIVHTGGINIADEYADISKKYGIWFDANVKITGKAVRSYSLLFLEDWKFIAKKELNYKKYLLEKNQGKSNSILVEDSPEIDFPLLKNSLIMWIYNAKKTIILSTPYLVPDREIINALKIVALSGVQIQIYLPGKADKNIVYFATKYWINELLSFNIQFYKIPNIFLHSKMAIFDNQYAYFGTVNLDMRSLYFQLETLNLITGSAIKDIQNIFDYYHQISKKIEKENLKINWWKRKLLILYVNIFSILM